MRRLIDELRHYPLHYGLPLVGLVVLVVAVVALRPQTTASATPPAEPTVTAEASPAPTATPQPPTPSTQMPRAGSAQAALAQLPVKGRAPKTGYQRDKFGGGWATVNGCDMRNRILARDLDHIVYAADSTCTITSGRLADPDTAKRIRFVYGGASEVDIDHVVSLGDAWQKGAQRWSYVKRVRFANDPLNLLAVDASANRQKGDGDAATWLPPSKSFRCTYVARQIAVKHRYGAWVTAAEKDAMQRVLSGCPSQSLPTSRRLHITVISRPRPTLEATPEPKRTRPKARYFENCTAVHTAGYAQLERGDGRYERNAQMDRDGDGIACEQ